MNKNIKLLIESFFNDIENDIYRSEDDNTFHLIETSKMFRDEIIKYTSNTEYTNLTEYPDIITLDMVARYKLYFKLACDICDIRLITDFQMALNIFNKKNFNFKIVLKEESNNLFDRIYISLSTKLYDTEYIEVDGNVIKNLNLSVMHGGITGIRLPNIMLFHIVKFYLLISRGYKIEKCTLHIDGKLNVETLLICVKNIDKLYIKEILTVSYNIDKYPIFVDENNNIITFKQYHILYHGKSIDTYNRDSVDILELIIKNVIGIQYPKIKYKTNE